MSRSVASRSPQARWAAGIGGQVAGCSAAMPHPAELSSQNAMPWGGTVFGLTLRLYWRAGMASEAKKHSGESGANHSDCLIPCWRTPQGHAGAWLRDVVGCVNEITFWRQIDAGSDLLSCASLHNLCACVAQAQHQKYGCPSTTGLSSSSSRPSCSPLAQPTRCLPPQASVQACVAPFPCCLLSAWATCVPPVSGGWCSTPWSTITRSSSMASKSSAACTSPDWAGTSGTRWP